jgi:hypothetical protein
MVDAGSAAAGLSMLASILSIARSVKELMSSMRIGGKEALEVFRKRASDKEKKILEVEGVGQTVIAITVISSALLAQLEEEAQECEAKHIRDRKKAGRDSTKGDIADRNAAHCMCAVLKSIRIHNKGRLPKGQLQDWWASYGCT